MQWYRLSLVYGANTPHCADERPRLPRLQPCFVIQVLALSTLPSTLRKNCQERGDAALTSLLTVAHTQRSEKHHLVLSKCRCYGRIGANNRLSNIRVDVHAS